MGYEWCWLFFFLFLAIGLYQWIVWFKIEKQIKHDSASVKLGFEDRDSYYKIQHAGIVDDKKSNALIANLNQVLNGEIANVVEKEAPDKSECLAGVYKEQACALLFSRPDDNTLNSYFTAFRYCFYKSGNKYFVAYKKFVKTKMFTYDDNQLFDVAFFQTRFKTTDVKPGAAPILYTTENHTTGKTAIILDTENPDILQAYLDSSYTDLYTLVGRTFSRYQRQLVDLQLHNNF